MKLLKNNLVWAALAFGLMACGSDSQVTTLAPSIEIELIDTFGGPNSDDGRKDVEAHSFGFGVISALSTGSEGNMYVLDRINNSVTVYSPAGDIIQTREYVKGEGPEEFLSLMDVTAVGSEIFVLDGQQRHVKVLNSSLNIVRQFPVSGRPTGLMAMNSGLLLTKLWLTSGEDVLYFYGFDGEEKGSYFQKPTDWQEMAKTGNFERMAKDSDSNIYFVPPIPNVLYKLTEQGAVVDSVVVMEDLALTSEDRPANVTSSEFAPKGLAVHPNGFLFHLVQEGRVASINVYDEDLDPVAVLDSTQIGLSSFSHIAIDSRGLLYLGASNPVPQVRKFNLKFSR